MIGVDIDDRSWYWWSKYTPSGIHPHNQDGSKDNPGLLLESSPAGELPPPPLLFLLFRKNYHHCSAMLLIANFQKTNFTVAAIGHLVPFIRLGSPAWLDRTMVIVMIIIIAMTITDIIISIIIKSIITITTNWLVWSGWNGASDSSGFCRKVSSQPCLVWCQVQLGKICQGNTKV